MTDQEKLKRKLNMLMRRKSAAPSYQKELIRREISRTRQLLKSVYGQDTEQAPFKKKAAIGVVSVAMLMLYAKKRSGSRSLEDILYLGETKGGRYYVKVYRTINPGLEERVRRNDTLHEIVQGELAIRQIPRDPNKSDKEHYFELFGQSWADFNKDWRIKTDNMGYACRSFEEIQYTAQKHIFNDSIRRGITYYIKFKPTDMFDPIEEDGFSLLANDAAKNITDLYQQRDFMVGKYGNRDRFRWSVAMKNLEDMGYQNMSDILEAGKNHETSLLDYKRIKDSLSRASYTNVPPETINLLNFVENVWKQAWTIDARRDARRKAKRMK